MHPNLFLRPVMPPACQLMARMPLAVCSRAVLQCIGTIVHPVVSGAHGCEACDRLQSYRERAAHTQRVPALRRLGALAIFLNEVLRARARLCIICQHARHEREPKRNRRARLCPWVINRRSRASPCEAQLWNWLWTIGSKASRTRTCTASRGSMQRHDKGVRGIWSSNVMSQRRIHARSRN